MVAGMLHQGPALGMLFSRSPLLLGQVAIIEHRLGQIPYNPPQNAADDLQMNGAIVDVQLAPAGGGTPKAVKAMIDTGASITAVYVPVGQAAALTQTGSTQLGGVGGTTESPIYAASVEIPQFGVKVDPLQIAGVLHPLPGVEMLIGRDLLHTLRLDYKGAAGVFVLSPDESAPAPAAGGAAAPPPPPPGALPQPPAGGLSTTTVLVGGGALLAAGTIALFLFDVI